MDNNIYLTNQVAKRLDISIATVRNYAKALERAGHEFTKRKQARLWTDTEIDLIEQVQRLYNNNDYPLELCFEYIVKREQEGEAAAADILEQPHYITKNEPLSPEISDLVTTLDSGLSDIKAGISKIDYQKDFDEIKALLQTDQKSIEYQNDELKKGHDTLKNENADLLNELKALEDEKQQLEEQIKALKGMNTFEFWKFKRD